MHYTGLPVSKLGELSNEWLEFLVVTDRQCGAILGVIIVDVRIY